MKRTRIQRSALSALALGRSAASALALGRSAVSSLAHRRSAVSAPARGRSAISALVLVMVAAALGAFLAHDSFVLGQDSAPGDIPVNVGLPERRLLIQRAGETVAEFTVEIADTTETQRIGLMGRTELPWDRGMLFIWDSPFRVSMWMKNTLIPLDFIFVREDGRIAWITHNVPPCPPVGDCPGYGSPVPVSMVLEIAGGLSQELGLRIGDRLVLHDDE